MERIFDLPAHPLLVHFPVVAIPVLSLMALAMVVSRRARRSFGLPSVVLGVICLVSTWFASRSGEALVEPLFLESVIKEHRSLGQTTLVFLLIFVVLLTAFVASSRLADRGDRDDNDLTGDDGELDLDGEAVRAAAGGPGRLRSISLVLSALVVVFAVLTTTWVARTGHEGARVTWEGQLPPAE